MDLNVSLRAALGHALLLFSQVIFAQSQTFCARLRFIRFAMTSEPLECPLEWLDADAIAFDQETPNAEAIRLVQEATCTERF